MLRSLFTSATGLAAQQLNLDVVANNLANVSTTGFKSSRAEFEDLVYQSLRDPGSQTGPGTTLPTGSQVGLGVSQGTTIPIQRQGTPQSTGNDTDLSISGNGFFAVQLPDGTTGYTRAGSFNTDSTGRLVTQEGYPLKPEIIVPPLHTSLSISGDGQVSVLQPGQQNATVVGTIQLTTFPNPSGLKAEGGTIFLPTNASGNPVTANPGAQGTGTLKQHSIEASNVDVVEEMVRMIVIQRAYDTNSKVIQAADEMLNTTNSIKR